MAKLNLSRKKSIRNCLECSEPFTITTHPKKKYCSHRCAIKHIVRNRKPKPSIKIPRICKKCGTTFWKLPCDTRTNKTRKIVAIYCSRKCYSGDRWPDDLPRPEIYKCTCCGESKPSTTKFFPASNRLKIGIRSVCKKCTANYARKKGKPYRQKIRLEVLSNYSNGEIRCRCCGETAIEFMTLDHIEGGGNEDRRQSPGGTIFFRLRREGYPPGFQVLCLNCNWSYGHYGYCPHQKQKV